MTETRLPLCRRDDGAWSSGAPSTGGCGVYWPRATMVVCVIPRMHVQVGWGNLCT